MRGSIALVLLLDACAGSEPARIARMVPSDSDPARFVACHGSNCKHRTEVGLGPAEWQAVSALLRPAAASPAEERRQVALAIGAIERYVAPQAGTGGDVAGNLAARNQSGQLDCVDETVNTMTALRMLAADGLLRWHRLGQPAHRGYIVDGMLPHNTAVLLETETGRPYAIDSFFSDSGEPAHVLPLGPWLAGWRPEHGPPATDEAAIR